MADIEQIEVTWPDDSATYRRGHFFPDCSSSNPFKPKKVNKLGKPNKFKHLYSPQGSGPLFPHLIYNHNKPK